MFLAARLLYMLNNLQRLARDLAEIGSCRYLYTDLNIVCSHYHALRFFIYTVQCGLTVTCKPSALMEQL
jgi:hypothetical protein